MVSADAEALVGVSVLSGGASVVPIERGLNRYHQGLACGAGARGARGVGVDSVGSRWWGGRSGRCDAWDLDEESGRGHA
jgi:hypothetical protein